MMSCSGGSGQFTARICQLAKYQDRREEALRARMEVLEFFWLETRIHPTLIDKTQLEFDFKKV